MTARLFRFAALSAALVAAPAFAKGHKYAKHHAVHKHARTATRHTRAHRAQLAKADSEPVAAPAPATSPSTDGDEATSTGTRRVVTHSVYGSSTDRATE